MQKPSDRWKLTRRTALERTHRIVTKRLEPLFLVLLICSAIYLSGLSGLLLSEHNQAFSFLSGFAVGVVAFCGVLIPFIFVSTITLLLATRDIKKMIEE